jgi:hypothetical protein
MITHLHGIERNLLLARRRNATRRGGHKAQQRRDRARCMLTRAQFQHLSQQQQHSYHRRRLEVYRNQARPIAQFGRKKAPGARSATML